MKKKSAITKNWNIFAATILLLIGISNQTQASIILLEDFRQTVKLDTAESRTTTTNTPDTPFSNWYTSNQTSEFTDSSIFVTTNAYRRYSIVEDRLTEYRSLFKIKFLATEDTNISISGNLSTQQIIERDYGDGTHSSVKLNSPNNTTSIAYSTSGEDFDEYFNSLNYSESESLNFSENIFILAGEYTLIIESRAYESYTTFDTGTNSSINISFDSNIEISPIPLPASIWLFISGGIILLGKRKRQNRN